jgi:CBS domain-containing protein
MMTDPLEVALADETVAAIQTQPFAAVTPNASIADAVARLANLEVGCLLVAENGKLFGVFSNRDVLDKVADRYDQIKDRAVSEVTTSNPIFVHETDSAAAALHVMAVSGFRHVPVMNLNDEPVGIVSPQRVLGFLREHFQAAE